MKQKNEITAPSVFPFQHHDPKNPKTLVKNETRTFRCVYYGPAGITNSTCWEVYVRKR